MPTRVILLNGPASTGKDTLGDSLVLFPSVRLRSFKTALVNMTKKVYKINSKDWDDWYHEGEKELPRPALMGMSCREALIYMSEEVGKPIFGLDVWGKAVAETMTDDGCTYVITDSGFKEEAQVLVDKFGAENIHVVRLMRVGKTFEGDSRDYLEPEMFDNKVKFYDVSLSPVFEGETHYSVTQKVAESLYKDVTGVENPITTDDIWRSYDYLNDTVKPIKASNK